IRSDSRYKETDRIAIITDHDMMNHARYNNRELPVYEGIFLPPNVTLIYASADNAERPGQEDIASSLIRACDSAARSALRQLRDTGKATSTDGASGVSLDQIP